MSEMSLEARATRFIRFGRSPFMPANAPLFFTRADGARVWDTSGREYLDLMCAGGPNILGYRHPRVERAAERQRALGDTMGGVAPIAVDCAEKLVGMVSHAAWALFAKGGTDATSGALRIARAHTGKRWILVAKGSYHGWASWCTPFTAGVLAPQREFISHYSYNDIDSLEVAVAAADGDLAAIFATGIKHDSYTDQELPTPEFAQRCRELCDDTGALLVIDDVRAGFRVARDCSWSVAGVMPDLSCWSKALANGYPLAAVLGSERARDGLEGAVVGGTFWQQAVPIAAAQETLTVLSESPYLEHLSDLGNMLRTGLQCHASDHQLELIQSGPVSMPLIRFKDDSEYRLGMAFVSAMIERGIYIRPCHNLFLCAAMTKHDIVLALEAADQAFAYLARHREEIESSVAPMVFRDGVDPR